MNLGALGAGQVAGMALTRLDGRGREVIMIVLGVQLHVAFGHIAVMMVMMMMSVWRGEVRRRTRRRRREDGTEQSRAGGRNTMDGRKIGQDDVGRIRILVPSVVGWLIVGSGTVVQGEVENSTSKPRKSVPLGLGRLGR